MSVRFVRSGNALLSGLRWKQTATNNAAFIPCGMGIYYFLKRWALSSVGNRSREIHNSEVEAKS